MTECLKLPLVHMDFSTRYLGNDAVYASGDRRILVGKCISQIDEYHQHAALMTGSAENDVFFHYDFGL